MIRRLTYQMFIASMRNYVSSFVSTEYDQYRILAEDTTYVPPFACSFGNTRMNAQYLAVADEEGMIGIINAEHDARWEQENPRTRWLAHHNAIFDICWTSDDRHLVSAAGDQTVRIWDVETQKCTIIFQGHNCSIKSVANHPRNPHLFATAARDGRIMTWDTRCSSIPTDSEELYYRPTNTINSAHALTNGTVQGPRKPRRSASALSATTNPSQSVTSVRYVPSVETMLVSSGAADGLIKIWDMRSPGSYSRKDAPLPQAMSSPLEGARRAHGFSSLCLNSRGSRIYAACTDNYVYEFDTNHLGKPIQRFSGAEYRCDTFYIKTTMSPDDRFLASGSSDHGLYIWEVDAPHKPPLALRAHRGEVTGVSWSKQELSQLASCSDDASVRIWNVDMDYNEDEQNMAYRDSRGRAEEGRLREEQEPAAPKERTPSRARTSDENDENEPPRPVSASSRVDRSSATSTPPPLSSARRGRAGQPAGSRRSGSASRSGSRAPNGRTIADYFPSPTTLR
ncbi:WD40-repeat-containing domain protein [Powellomyces hirtus]|nr:WD40-repeat-containing domain protein [Powellomyces hirtus]